MKRWSGAALVAAMVASMPAARAEDLAATAAGLNDSGKSLFVKGHYAEAAVVFERAHRLAPDPRYAFNLCFTLNLLGSYAEALAACRAAKNPPPALHSKLDDLTRELESRVTRRSADTGPAFARPIRSLTGYRWSIGLEGGFVHNLSLGEGLGRTNYEEFGPVLGASAQFVFGESRVGGRLRGFIGRLPATAENLAREPLGILGLGLSAYVDVPLTANWLLTPEVGPSLLILDPGESSLVAIGGRGSVSIARLLGKRARHALTVTPAYEVYAGAQGSRAPLFGLDRTSSMFSMTIGYAFRFDAPFGSEPLLTLE